MSSNIGQTYPYSSEFEEERAAAVASTLEAHEGLEAQVAEASLPLGSTEPGENGAAIKWWTWVCPKCVTGRLHVAGFSIDRHGLLTVCDGCGGTFAR